MSKLIINEPPIQLLPSLAAAIGLNEAIVLQQLHYWLTNKNSGIERDGYRWIYNTYEEWQENNFPFWSERTIARTFLSLEDQGLVIAERLEARSHDQRKYYRIDYEALEGKEEEPENALPEQEPPEEEERSFPPPPTIEWAILAGTEVTEDMLETEQQRFVRDVEDAAFLITQNNLHLRPLAEAFMLARHIVLSTDSGKQRGHRKALQEMYDAKPNQVKPDHIREAVGKLVENGMTVSDLWAVVKTAKDIANPAPGAEADCRANLPVWLGPIEEGDRNYNHILMKYGREVVEEYIKCQNKGQE